MGPIGKCVKLLKEQTYEQLVVSEFSNYLCESFYGSRFTELGRPTVPHQSEPE